MSMNTGAGGAGRRYTIMLVASWPGRAAPCTWRGPDQTELVTENEHLDDLQCASCSSEHGAGRSGGGTAVLPYGIHGFCFQTRNPTKTVCNQKHLKGRRKQGPTTPLPVIMRRAGGGAGVETPDTCDDSSSAVTSDHGSQVQGSSSVTRHRVQGSSSVTRLRLPSSH